MIKCHGVIGACLGWNCLDLLVGLCFISGGILVHGWTDVIYYRLAGSCSVTVIGYSDIDKYASLLVEDFHGLKISPLMAYAKFYP